MELATQAPRVIGYFTNLHVNTIRSLPGEAHSCLRQRRLKVAVEFVAVPMALTNLRGAIGSKRETSFRKMTRISSEAHGATELILVILRKEVSRLLPMAPRRLVSAIGTATNSTATLRRR